MPDAEDVAAWPVEAVPVADRDAQVVLHALAADQPVGVVDPVGETVSGRPVPRALTGSGTSAKKLLMRSVRPSFGMPGGRRPGRGCPGPRGPRAAGRTSRPRPGRCAG